jgi:hypothetical protein
MQIEISPKEYEQRLNWHDGMLYCQLLVIDDKNDWRMPSLDELCEIFTSNHDFLDWVYWSSDEVNGGAWAWGQSFKLYGQNQHQLKYGEKYMVRPVRNI